MLSGEVNCPDCSLKGRLCGSWWCKFGPRVGGRSPRRHIQTKYEPLITPKWCPRKTKQEEVSDGNE